MNNIYSKLQQIKQQKNQKLNLFISEENQQIIRELKASKKVNLFMPTEFSFLYSPLTEKKYVDAFKKLFWGISINEDLEKLYCLPPTTISVWIDYDYTPHSQWAYDSNDFVNLYVIHSKEELLELIDWLIETQNKSHSFFESYDNDEIVYFIENILNKNKNMGE